MSLLARKLMDAPAGGAATRTYLGQTSSETDLSSYTFSSQSLGTATSDRRIVVAVANKKSSGTGDIPSSVTVGGVSASLVVSVADTSDRGAGSIWIADVPTGATGDIVVTFANTQQRCGIGWWAAYGLTSSTATDTASSVSSPATLDVDVSAGGLAFGAGGSGGSATTTHTWTGLTEDYDTGYGSSFGWHSGASIESAGGGTPLAITCTGSGTPTNDHYVAASFR